jgi:AraC family transcriptional regulator
MRAYLLRAVEIREVNSSKYESAIARAFGLRDAPVLASRTLKKSAMSVTEIRSDRRNFGVTASIPREDAYLIALQIRECPDHDLFFDDRHVTPRNYVEGMTTIYDLRRNPIADIRDPFHALMFHLPHSALHDLADEAGAPRISDLQYEPGVSVADPVVRHLLLSLLPAMSQPEEARPLFLDHVALAITVHIARQYGAMRIGRRPPRGGLAPWQERRAKDLLNANLEGEVPLSRLAAECGLSVRHFARAFRQSAGVPPHRWLMKRRVELARELLRDPARSLSEIALACGFSDQSHFTRVFTAMVGASPGGWRRMQR